MKKLILGLVLLAMIVPVYANGTQDGKAVGSDGPMEISFGYWKEELFGGDYDREDDQLVQLIEEKFNVRITPRFVTWGDYKEKYKLWAAAGQLPDFFVYNPPTVTLNDWVEQGVIRALPEDMSAYPHLKETLEREDVAYLAIDGKHYKFPRIHSLHPHVSLGMYVRKDWLQKLNLDLPETWEEFEAMCKLFATSDLDGNGRDDTIVIHPKKDGDWKYLVNNLCPFYIGKYWVQEDGRWVPPLYSKMMPKALETVGKMYQDKILYQDFLLIQDSTVSQEKFSAGNVGVFLSQADPPRLQNLKNIWERTNPDKPFFDYVQLVDTYPFKHDDGVNYHRNRTGWWAHNFFRGDVSDEKVAKILEIWEFLHTDEGQNLWYRGIEGKDYKVEGDKIVDTRPLAENGEKKSVSEMYPGAMLFGGMAYWGMDRVFFNMDELNFTRHDKEVVEITAKYGKLLDEKFVAWPTSRAISEFGNNYLASKSIPADPREYIEAALIADDPVAAWNKTLEMFKREGLEEYIDYVNEQIEVLGLE